MTCMKHQAITSTIVDLSPKVSHGKPMRETSWEVLIYFIRSMCSGAARSWWRHQMETFSALLAICVGNSPVPGEFPAQRPATRSFDIFFDLCRKKRLSKQLWGWWFETPSHPLWRHCNVKTTATCPRRQWDKLARMFGGFLQRDIVCQAS